MACLDRERPSRRALREPARGGRRRPGRSAPGERRQPVTDVLHDDEEDDIVAPGDFEADGDSTDRSSGAYGDRRATAPKPVVATPYRLHDAACTPRRQFLYGRHAIRGFVSVTAAGGGVGKTTLKLAEGVALAIGRDLLSDNLTGSTPVWYLGLEDPLEEYDRRVVGIRVLYEVGDKELGGRFFLDSGRDQNFIIASETRIGVTIVEPIVSSIIENIERYDIGQIVVDPFVACHAISENDNNKLEKVTREWARIAQATNCAVELVAHIRKGNGGLELSAEDVRGASALVNAARSVRILTPMSKEEAEKAGVEERRRFFRISFGKANLILPSDAADWREMKTISLGNGGDEVGVAARWAWPDPLESIDVAGLRAAQLAVSKGKWRENSQAKDWVGIPAEALKLDIEDKAVRNKIKGLLKIWIANGMFVVVDGKDEKRETRSYVEVGRWAND
jgi:hypothetical protein